jgi:hypothetical protein
MKLEEVQVTNASKNAHVWKITNASKNVHVWKITNRCGTLTTGISSAKEDSFLSDDDQIHAVVN